MGYRNHDEFKRVLNGGKSAAFLPNGDPSGMAPTAGPWPFAFPDSVRADRASEGVATLRAYTAFDPDINYVDLFEPARNDFEWGPAGDVYFAEGSDANSRSGGKSLVLRYNGPHAGFSEADSQPFRLIAGAQYRVLVLYKTTGSGANLFQLNLFQLNYNRSTLLATSFVADVTKLPGTSNVWAAYSKTITVDANTQWGVLRAIGNPVQDVYIDAIFIERVSTPLGFRAIRNPANQNANSGVYTPIICNDTNIGFNNSGGAYDTTTGVFTAPETGYYTFSGGAILLGVADQKQVVVTIRHNGTRRALLSVYASGATGNPGGEVTSGIMRLNKGDTVDLAIYNGDTGIRTIPASDQTFFSGYKIDNVSGVNVSTTIDAPSGGWHFVEERIVSAESSVDFILPSTYDDFQFVIDKMTVSVDGAYPTMRCSTDGGGTFAAAATDYQWIVKSASATDNVQRRGVGSATTSDSSIALAGIDSTWGLGNAATNRHYFTVEIFNVKDTTREKRVRSEGQFQALSSAFCLNTTEGIYQGSTSAVSAIRLAISSGTFSGKVRVFGRTSA